MFKRSSKNSRRSTTRLSLVIALGCGLLLLGALFSRQPAPRSAAAPDSSLAPSASDQKVERQEKSIQTSGPRLQGAEARKYLEQPGEGQSLMQAITAARFGLKSQERGPFGEAGAGYLGLSHVQNLNAWFAEDGVRVRPTVADAERGPSWHLDLRLKAYGYGNDLMAVPPIVSQHVKDNRIEYERFDCRLSIADCRFQETRKSALASLQSPANQLFQSAIGNRKSAITEWYENRAEGIEQGFTLAARPERNVAIGSDEPLRLSVSLNGDLTALAKDEGQAIELRDSHGKPALIYTKLTALDAAGKQLAARMEAHADGKEIALVVDDRDASYPIVIDPIVATLEKILDLGGGGVGAQFGDAVAIDGDRAIVGAWLNDESATVTDIGGVYIFNRVGSTWSPIYGFAIGTNHAKCGYSVAISSTTAVFGCPGANANTGTARILDLIHGSGSSEELVDPNRTTGDFFGASVATSGNYIVVGAPSASLGAPGLQTGSVVMFAGRNWTDSWTQHHSNEQFGASVAMDGDVVLVGAPGAAASTGSVIVLRRDGIGSLDFQGTLSANDGAAGDQFGTGIAITDGTAIIGAPGDDDKGTEAGAAYVFVRVTSSQWSQQQKLTASDGRADDIFSYNAVAIEGNTIVVGARRQDGVSSNPSDNRGAAYVFTRSGTVWTQQTKINPPAFFGAPGDEFGTSVGIDDDRVIVSSPRAAATNGTANTGTAPIFHLDCVPPYSSFIDDPSNGFPIATRITCPGSTVDFDVLFRGSTGQLTTFQWRRNGVNIPGATTRGFRIPSASASDAGTYDVILSNACGSDISLPANVIVPSFSLNSSSQNVGAAGGNGSVSVTTTGSCAWTAASNANFITVTSGASGNGNGTVNFSVGANPNAGQRTGSITIAGNTFTITQDGAAATPNVVQFSASSYSVGEDCTIVAITVNRIGDTSGAASVDYNTADVTASERRDYTTALGKLRFAAGETTKSFVVLINEDSYVEGPETFNVNLSNPSGVTLGVSVATVQINDDPSEPASNSIDDPQTFVGEHYHDFLNRQSDPSGLAFWTNELTSCGTDQSCIQLKRVNVSAAYFLSIEFQQTGYLVERLYKTAYGNGSGASAFGGTHQLPVPIVRLQEFLRDTQQIGQGVIVGQAGWQAALEINKQAFAADFVQRSRFTTAFPNVMTAAQFVDGLNANAGNPLSASERTQLVNDLSTSAKTRAQVLRTIAEHPNLVNAESNRAFVLMQYFGYLRRNPNDSPDADYTGYDFWLTKLNQFNGDFVSAEMVKAFITSSEYRQRFGQQ